MLRVRWLGRVAYRDALALQHALHRSRRDPYLLMMEHQPVYTMGVRARSEHVLRRPESVGAELVRADRGGDVTYHGPGQLVGYPLVDLAMGPGAVPAHVGRVEEVIIGALGRLGLAGAGRLPGYPGVWVEPGGASPRKIAAVGIRVSRSRTMHGFALNVDPDLAMFGHIVPCGLAGSAVTSLRAEGISVEMAEVMEVVAGEAACAWGNGGHEIQRVTGRGAGRRGATSTGLPLASRKPVWLRAPARMGPAYRATERMLSGLDLVTVCEEAGCPNIYECWADGTATFMINGDRCTRACRFCLVDTRRPAPPDPTEPERVAEAVGRAGLDHAVVTAVARDDLADGGASAFAATISAIRRHSPGTTVEVLIPDCKGDPRALATVFEARPDVLNHNLETVARLQRLVRPSASYARSLAVLGRASAAGFTTKSGLILGMGEDEDEVLGALADLRAVGTRIVTMGQYLRPSAAHLPVARWWTPAEIETVATEARAMGFAHVEASPLTRSSYHARGAARAAVAATTGRAS